MSSVNTTRANGSMYHELIASNIWLTLLVDYIQTLDTSSKYISCTLKKIYNIPAKSMIEAAVLKHKPLLIRSCIFILKGRYYFEDFNYT